MSQLKKDSRLQQIRLNQADQAALKTIRDETGMNTEAGAIRYALHAMARSIREKREKGKDCD